MKDFMSFVLVALIVGVIKAIFWPGNSPQYAAEASLVPVSAASYTGVAMSGNNPLGIKFSDFVAGLGGEDSGVRARDGGTFARFGSYRDGMTAGKRLLLSGGYRDLSVDAAMRRWSNGGYGAEIASLPAYQRVGNLTDSQLDSLLAAMARREGTSVSF